MTFVPAREDDNMVMTLNNTIFVGRSRPNTFTTTQTNIQFRVLDTLEEKSSLKEEEEEPPPPHKRAVPRAHLYA